MNTLFRFAFTLFVIFGLTIATHAQTVTKPITLESEPWKESQLLTPETLAAQLKSNDFHSVILNIGAVEDIKDAKHVGPARDAENIAKLDKVVAALPKNTPLIIYCGCCPLHTKCPNAKPAYNELTKLGFTNIKVLDLVTNLKTDWTDKGYPLAGK